VDGGGGFGAEGGGEFEHDLAFFDADSDNGPESTIDADIGFLELIHCIDGSA
jgi:hypothetical protein